MNPIRTTLTIFFFVTQFFAASAQGPIKNLILRIDTSSYSWPAKAVTYQERKVLPIVISAKPTAMELQLVPRAIANISSISFLPQSDFVPLDSLELFQNEFFLTKVRLNNSLEPGIKNIAFKVVRKNRDSVNLIYPILPTIPSNISIPPKNYLLLVGEVSQISLLTDFPDNIKSFNTWKRNSRYAYRIIKKDGQNFLELIPFEPGNFEIRLSIECNFPHQTGKSQKITYYQRLEPFEFEAKRGSLKFLDLGLDDVLLGRGEKALTQSISFPRPLELDVKRTYRLETGEELGSKLVGEITTQKLLSGGQIQGLFTLYNYHNREDGALFVKYESKSIFQTNLNIIPKTTVGGILEKDLPISRKYWVARPDENVKISWVGESLDRATWTIKGSTNQLDIKKRSFNEDKGYEKATLEFQIPKNIKDRRLELLQNGNPTGYYIKIEEWSRPQDLSYISLGFPERNTRMYGNKMIKRPYYFDQLEDTDIGIHTEQIEKDKLLYGTQYLNMHITLFDPQGRVLEKKEYKTIGIRPGKHSPRHNFYSSKSWRDTTLKLEKILSYPIEEAAAWSKVQIDIAHDTARYDTGIKQIQFNLILRKKVDFNVELSIPVGIISNHPDHVDGTRIDGASIFLMGQLGIYQKNKVNKLHKFRFATGIVALNALNFRRVNRVDLGVGSMLQLFPTSQNAKLSVPLYIGGGYAITRNYWFFYSGAGLSVKLN